MANTGTKTRCQHNLGGRPCELADNHLEMHSYLSGSVRWGVGLVDVNFDECVKFDESAPAAEVAEEETTPTARETMSEMVYGKGSASRQAEGRAMRPCEACGIVDRCKPVGLVNGSVMMLCEPHRRQYDGIISEAPIDGAEDMRHEEALKV